MKQPQVALRVLLVIGLLSARPALHAQGVVFQTSVAPQADEDLASDCRYEITLTNSSRTVRGVWVIFDRGRDMLRYYGDPDVQAFAERHDLALLLAFHCGAKSSDAGGDMNVDPSKGIGRALFSALTQFAQSSRHAELASAKVILLGFSGAGSLAGRFPAYAPDRVLAVIAANPGHNPLGVDTIDLSRKTAAVPQLILAGSADAITGTRRPYAYLRKHFEQGAPWTFVLQNETPHCCVINAKALVLQWLGTRSSFKGSRHPQGSMGSSGRHLQRRRSALTRAAQELQFGVAAPKIPGVARIGQSRTRQSLDGRLHRKG